MVTPVTLLILNEICFFVTVIYRLQVVTKRLQAVTITATCNRFFSLLH
jgi:hypothetical protein